MKKIICVIAAIAVLGYCIVGYCAENEMVSAIVSGIKIIIDGNELETENEPVIINDRTYLPLRAIAEGIGADVDYNEEENSVAISTNDTGYPGDDWEESFYIGEDGLAYICFRDMNGNIRLKTNYLSSAYYDERGEEEFFEENAEVMVGFSILGFNNGLITIGKIDKDGRRGGYMDIYGNEILMGKFQETYDFSEGLAAVSTKKLTSSVGVEMGFINIAGEMVIPEKYLAVMRFSEGVCAVSEDGFLSMNWYFIDKNGERVFGDKTFIRAGIFKNGYCPVQTKGVPIQIARSEENVEKFSYIDHTGNLATDEEWDYVSTFNDGYAIVENDGVTMKINTDFEVVEILED